LRLGAYREAATTLLRCAVTTGYRQGDVVEALTKVYRHLQDIPALQQLWKRRAVAALEADDVNRFLEYAYVSIYAETFFAEAPNYRYAHADDDLNSFVRLAARSHPLYGWVQEHR